LSFLNEDGQLDISDECDIETQFQELKGARAKRIKSGEYSMDHKVETVHLQNSDELQKYYDMEGLPIGEGLPDCPVSWTENCYRWG
jgi:hypothetical protein